MPSNANPDIVEAFLASAIFLIADKKGHSTTLAIRAMLQYMRHDPKIFARMKPNKVLLRKMDLGPHFVSEQVDRDASLELASFMLRYHIDIDYMDFTDDFVAIRVLRRYEDVKYAAEIENVTKTVEQLSDRLIKFE